MKVGLFRSTVKLEIIHIVRREANVQFLSYLFSNTLTKVNLVS